jgi:hypothetical protein
MSKSRERHRNTSFSVLDNLTGFTVFWGDRLFAVLGRGGQAIPDGLKMFHLQADGPC